MLNNCLTLEVSGFDCYWRAQCETTYLTRYFLCPTDVRSLSYELSLSGTWRLSVSVIDILCLGHKQSLSRT